MSDAPTGALAGTRVLDLSTRLSGAFCARILGDLGADVVLVEGDQGHPLRLEPPFLHDEPGIEHSLLHAYANFNKRSVIMAPASATSAELVRAADVVVVSDRATLESIRPSLSEAAIVVAITPHGLTGPRAEAPGNDLTAYALSGWAALNGLDGSPPLKGSMNQAGYVSGVIAVVGTLSALHERDLSSRGQELDISETEALTLIAGPSLLMAAYEGRESPRQLPDVFAGPVPANDGYVSITFSRAHFWRDAMNALGLEHLAEDPRYLDTWQRRQYRADLTPQIEEQVAARGRWDLFEHLGLLRCVCGVVLDMADLDSNPHLHERGLFVETSVGSTDVKVPGAAFKMSATPWAHRRGAPRLGEHTAEVLAELESMPPAPGLVSQHR